VAAVFSHAVAYGPFLDQHERIEQHPVAAGDFRREVRCANQLLRLYADVRGRDCDAIAKWFLGPLTPRGPMESTIVERYMERWRGSPEYGNVKWMLDQSMTTLRTEGE
jgi:hypothetical protein